MPSYEDFYDKVKPNLSEQYVPIQTDNAGLRKNVRSNTDMHLHGQYSTDGYKTIEQIVARCIENGVEWIAITDHNSFQAIMELRKNRDVKCHKTYVEYDGVKIFNGIEVSCIKKLTKQNSINLAKQKNLKLHMLCYGFDLDYDSIFLSMMTEKGNDYMMARYFPLYYLATKDDKYKTTLSEFKNFAHESAEKASFTGRINFSETMEFYKWKGIPAEEIKRDLKGFDFGNPTRDSIRLDVVDVINAVHASGGYCAVAHPVRNFERHRLMYNKNYEPYPYYTALMDNLLEIGCDGLEYSNVGDQFSTLFNQEYSNSFLTTKGTDTHDFGNKVKSDIGKFAHILPEANVVSRLLELERAKNLQIPTKRQKQFAQINNQNAYTEFDDHCR